LRALLLPSVVLGHAAFRRLLGTKAPVFLKNAISLNTRDLHPEQAA
jgi:hypothetical protein